MADFPTSPSTGDFFVTPGATYKYTGNAWTVVGPDTGVRISSVQEISVTASAPVEEIVGVKSITLQSGSVNAEPDVGKLFIEDNGVDSYTELLLHFDGADQATSTTDSSDSGHTITMTGAKIDNGASVFGTSSAYFDGNDYITIGDSDDWYFDSGDFAIEAFVNFSTVQDCWFVNQAASNNEAWGFGYQSSQLIFKSAASSWGSPEIILQTSWSPSTGVWYHVAVSREGTSFKLWVNGEQIGSTLTDSDSTPQLAASLTLGKWGASNASYFYGYLDEVRISKGIARYTSNFDPPTKQFGRPDLKIKDTYGSYNIKLKQIN